MNVIRNMTISNEPPDEGTRIVLVCTDRGRHKQRSLAVAYDRGEGAEGGRFAFSLGSLEHRPNGTSKAVRRSDVARRNADGARLGGTHLHCKTCGRDPQPSSKKLAEAVDSWRANHGGKPLDVSDPSVRL